MIWALLPEVIKAQHPKDQVIKVSVKTSKKGESYTLYLRGGRKLTYQQNILIKERFWN